MGLRLQAYVSVVLSAVLLTMSGWTSVGLGCTTFALPQSAEKIVGKSFDWHQDHGYVLVNARNVKKKALMLDPREPAAEWTSKYGSVSYHQHGRELPVGGLNEKGLTVEIMWLDTSEYPGLDKTPALTELQWIQYQLDGAATTAEAVQLAKTVRVVPVVAKVHYLVCDAAGACATFEYLKKKLVIHEGKTAPIPALANDSYEDSIRFLSQQISGMKPLPTGISSLARFTRAAALYYRFDPTLHEDAVDYAFRTLYNVRQPGYTTWNLVYESAGHRLHFRTKGLNAVQTVDTSKFDYSCKKAPQFLDMKTTDSGDVTGKFATFTDQHNLNLVQKGLGPFASQIPAGTVQLVAKYPLTLQCTE